MTPAALKFHFRYLRTLAAIGLIVLGACDATGSSDDSDLGPAGGKADQLDEGDTEAPEDEGDTEAAEDEPEVDPAFIEARDVELPMVVLDMSIPAPESYEYPPSGLAASLGGTEFWQRWSGGHSPTFSFSAGTEAGRKCMQASAIRFEAIMSDPPESLVRLREGTNWSGSFFNWNDDYTKSTWGSGSSRLWAWRTGLIKWISVTTAEDTCSLPTREMVESLAADCLERGESNEGEIQGCRN